MANTYSRFMAVAFAALCILAVDPGDARAQNADERKLHVSITPVLPLAMDDPEVVITYLNAGKKQLSLSLPKGKGEISWFRDLTMRIDHKPATYVFEVKHFDDPIRSRDVELRPGQNAELRIKLKTIFKMPEEWETIELRTTQEFRVGPQIVGHLTMRRVPHTFQKPIHVTAAPVLPMDFNDPKITVRFQNIGKKTFDLPLPKPGSETMMFWATDAKIDRKKVRSFFDRSPIGGYKKWTRFVQLKPGESTAIKIRLKDYFDIPRDWKLIEIAAKEFSLVRAYHQDILTLTRPLQQPLDVPNEVWWQSNDRVRWFLVKQHKRIEKLKAKSPN